jgi:hypothetical protein
MIQPNASISENQLLVHENNNSQTNLEMNPRCLIFSNDGNLNILKTFIDEDFPSETESIKEIKKECGVVRIYRINSKFKSLSDELLEHASDELNEKKQAIINLK